MRIFCIIAGILLTAELLQSETIHFKTAQDADAARAALITYIWGEAGPPSRRAPDSIDVGIQDPFYTSLYTDTANLDRIDRYMVDLGLGLKSYVYHFHARKPNGKLFVYHSGHSPGGYKGEDANINNNRAPGTVIPAMIRNGYDVLAFAMPLYGNTNPTIEISPDVSQQFIYHGQIFAYLTHPYTYFFDPIYICLNYIEDHFSYRSISMTGLSGGGWTTTLYQAIDPRIREGFEVAGSLPLDLRTGYEGFGDSEQGFDYNGLFGVTNYEELYCLAAYGAGRRHVQIHNRYDDQTFWGQRYVYWVDSVTSAVAQIGSGAYRFYSDEIAHRHTISPYALNIILDTTSTELPDVPVQFAPADGVTMSNEHVYFDWMQSNRADHFEFQLSADSTFAAPMICDSMLIGYRSEDSVSVTRNDTAYWRVAAINAAGRSAWSAVRRIVLPNAPPAITSLPPSSVVEEGQFQYQLTSTDPDSAAFDDEVSYRMTGLPSWLAYDSLAHQIHGMPPVGAPDTLIVIDAFDRRGGRCNQTAPVHVVHVNHVPAFKTAPPTLASEDSLYQYAFWAHDKDSTAFHDSVSYMLSTLPGWLALDSTGRRIFGTPSPHDVGQMAISVIAEDRQGSLTVQAYIIDVRHTNHAPKIMSYPIAGAVEDTAYHASVYASDRDSALFGDDVRYRFITPSSWLTIDSVSGEISGTPRITNLKDTLAAIRAYDNHGGADTAYCVIPIRHTNHPPVFTSIADSLVLEDSLYVYRPVLHDTDVQYCNDSLSVTVLAAPSFMRMDSTGTLLSGTAKNEFFAANQSSIRTGSNGPYIDTVITLFGRDRRGGSVLQQTSLRVVHRNHAPMIISAPDTTAAEDSVYHYHIDLYDIDQKVFKDSLYVSFIVKPSWLNFNAVSCELSGIPSGVNARDTIAVFEVLDGSGGRTQRMFPIHVIPVNHPPVIASVPPAAAYEDSLYSYAMGILDPDVEYKGDTVSVRIVNGPAWLHFSNNPALVSGKPEWNNIGDTVATVEVRDRWNATATQTWKLSVNAVKYAPQPAGLLFPAKIDTMAIRASSTNIHFGWMSAKDRNLRDTLSYRVHCWKGSYDTLSVWFRDTTWNMDPEEAVGFRRGFSWTVSVTDGYYTVAMKDTFSVILKDQTTGISAWTSTIPDDYIVYQNYPNPFNPSTTLRFGLPKQSRVTLDIYNSLGQRVETVYQRVELPPGYYEARWNASDRANGVYFAVLRARESAQPDRVFRSVKKLLLVK
jgi:hypothetical protein